MKVTLHVFSGRENPTWELLEKDAKAFLDRFEKKTVLSAGEHEFSLGYSGFSIDATSDQRLPLGLPSSFFVDGKLAAGISEHGHRIEDQRVTFVGGAERDCNDLRFTKFK